MPLPAPVGNQVRLTVGSEEMTILLSGEPRQPYGWAVVELTQIGSRLRDELMQYLPQEARDLVDAMQETGEWYLTNKVDNNPLWPLLGRILLSSKARAIINEIVISDFVAPRLRAMFTVGNYPPPLHSRVMLYLEDGLEPLHPHPFPINRVELGPEVL